MSIIVSKFGGTSLADRKQIERALDIVLADSRRKYVVVSAPGKRFKDDDKMTDQLKQVVKGSYEHLHAVEARISEIAHDNLGLAKELSMELRARARRGFSEEILAFGEYANAQMVDSALNARGVNSRVVDPQEAGLVIVNKGFPRPLSTSYAKMHQALLDGFDGITVFPGFYGSSLSGRIITLPRSGSDTTGSCVARAVNASVYENWTDTDGLRRADPSIVPNSQVIPEITFVETRELSYASFKLEAACLEPLFGTDVVMKVRNTNNLSHPGTTISSKREPQPEERIVGVAKQDGLVAINLFKPFIETEVGFGYSLLGILAEREIPYEHFLNGVDTMSLVLDRKYLVQTEDRDNRLEYIVEQIRRECNPESISTNPDGTLTPFYFSLVSVAGLGMARHIDTKVRIFGALKAAGIEDEMVDDGARDLSIFIGVAQERADDAVRAIYNEFYG